MSIFDPGDRPKLNRRQSLQLGAAATAAGLLGAQEMVAPAQAASGSGGGDPSFARGGYPTPAFADAMPEYNLPQFRAVPVLLSSLTPQPGKVAVPGETRREPHTAWETHPPQKYYEIFIEENKQVKLHRDLPFNTMWGFRQRGDPEGTAITPGPTFHVKVGEPILVRIWNKMPTPSRHQGYGRPEVTIHLHDNHNTPESDGNADDYFPKLDELDPTHNDPGLFRDYHWINKPAGADPSYPNDSRLGDPREAMGHLWYHDHRHGYTAANTYKGLVGMYLVYDNLDNNDETSRLPGHLALPSGKYEVPIVLADKVIDSSGHLVFDQLEMDGILGNKITVNGKIQPYLAVERRKYRFRVLNPGPSRIYGISIKVANNAVGDLRGAEDYPHVFFIGQAGTLFTQALPFVGPGLRVPAQRVEVVIDFSHVLAGQTVYAVNEFAQSNGNKPDGFIGNTVNGPEFRATLPGLPVLRFDVQPGPVTDPSLPVTVGRPLRAVPAIPAGVNALSEAAILAAVGKKYPFASAPNVATVRDWRFDRTNGQWAINNRLYDGEPAALCKQNTTELWILRNNSGGWVHPIHVHFEKFRTLYRANGLKPGPNDPQFGREDTLALGPGERAVIFMQFRDFTGKYLMHCHNTVHEDHAMMVRWDIVK